MLKEARHSIAKLGGQSFSPGGGSGSMARPSRAAGGVKMTNVLGIVGAMVPGVPIELDTGDTC